VAIAGTVFIGAQYALTRRALNLSIRPLLAEADPDTAQVGTETVEFGAPGRNVVDAPRASVYTNADGTKISVPFRNIGGGVAVITSATTKPPASGEVAVTRKFVAVGEHVRVNISRMQLMVEGNLRRIRGGR